LSAAARQNVFSSMTMAKAIMQQLKMETLHTTAGLAIGWLTE